MIDKRSDLLFVPYSQALHAVGADLDARNDAGASALHEAAARGFISIVEFLLQNGADIQAKMPDGTTPLFQAAFHNQVCCP